MDDWGYYLFLTCACAFFAWMAWRDIKYLNKIKRDINRTAELEVAEMAKQWVSPPNQRNEK